MTASSITGRQLSSLLGTAIAPAILEAANAKSAEDVDRFFRSDLYGMLSDPATGLWHLSPVLLAQMYADELSYGAFAVPEEQS